MLFSFPSKNQQGLKTCIKPDIKAMKVHVLGQAACVRVGLSQGNVPGNCPAPYKAYEKNWSQKWKYGTDNCQLLPLARAYDQQPPRAPAQQQVAQLLVGPEAPDKTCSQSTMKEHCYC